MSVFENAQLIRMLLSQLSAETGVDSTNLIGDQNQILFGLREMIRLNLISGARYYSEYSDATGPLLSSVLSIRLTRRGVALKEQ
ncbi:hypothetical protein A462_04691 [Pseudomonas sp. Ag1]|uniref:hypothetical protein n=1 Tax=Pseudomonas sp. Ag1 TaxID=1197727 RepID=UPI000272CACE|nr:hypothetical protein [Pseudomonas sp. Ag1]EJF73101.1 hypothetical protein A462_04691 [Pseudomonas sp. Ag1]